jgi:hypothetical protein
MARTIDGFYVDTDSGTFQWVNSLLDTHLKEVTEAIFRDGTTPEATEKLRGRRQEINLLKNKFEKACS